MIENNDEEHPALIIHVDRDDADSLADRMKFAVEPSKLATDTINKDEYAVTVPKETPNHLTRRWLEPIEANSVSYSGTAAAR